MARPSPSLLIVNYHTAALALEAIATARAASSDPLQVVVVDQSCDATEAATLRGHCDQLLVMPDNRGFAAGINAGRRLCDGETIVVANPDVHFDVHSIDLLAEALDGGAAVAGPLLTWDDEHRWLLPPAEAWNAADFFDAAMASRSTHWSDWRSARLLRSRIEFWRNRSARVIEAISGAVMAIRAQELDRHGGFDERFFLYFEETDFLRRVRRGGGEIRYVPGARCSHLYNQSAGQSTIAPGHFAISEDLYIRKWFGPVRALMGRGSVLPPPPSSELARPILDVSPGSLVEASPLATFESAAGQFADGQQVMVPEAVWSAYRQPDLYLRVIDPGSYRVLNTWRVRKLS